MDIPLFSWLHLSDIHFGEPGAAVRARKELILADLLHALPRALKEGMPRPDVILVTGDIAFSGAALSPDEYVKARDWLASVARAAGRRRTDIYLVPGNHDVQRAGEKEPEKLAVLTALRADETPTALDDALSQPAARKALLSRVQEYHEFARQLARDTVPSTEQLQAGRLDWSHVRVQGGLRVHLVGLNSALLANEDDRQERGRLQLGSTQVLELTRTDRRQELVIALLHHPVDYLRERDVQHRIMHHAHIQLFGHVHEQDDTYLRSGVGGQTVRVAAGAVHASAAEGPIDYGFSFGAVVPGPGQDELLLRVWPWKHLETGGGFQLDRNSVPRNQEYSEHPLGTIRRDPPLKYNAKAIAELATWLRQACAPELLEEVLARAKDLGATGGLLDGAGRRKEWADLLWKMNEVPGRVEVLLRGIHGLPGGS